MKNDFRLYTYKDYKLLIRSITKKREEDFPDIHQDLLLEICEMENDIFNNKVKIRNNNLFNYVYGRIRRAYKNLNRNQRRNERINKVIFIDKDLSEMKIIDKSVKSEDNIVNNAYIQEELLKKYNLTKQEEEFYRYYKDSNYSKKYIKEHLNIGENEYNKLRKSIRWKMIDKQKRRKLKLQP